MPIDAAAGETYWIMLGTDSIMPDFPPCTLSMFRNPGPAVVLG